MTVLLTLSVIVAESRPTTNWRNDLPRSIYPIIQVTCAYRGGSGDDGE